MTDKPKDEHVAIPYMNEKSKITEMHFVQLAMKNLLLVSDDNIKKFFLPAFQALIEYRKKNKDVEIISKIVPVTEHNIAERNHKPDNEDGA